ncbi:MAG: putative rane protein [Cyanobacteria bacterium RYN_339]|nr:putative rane protein [Cyanobacteria bacterium RYN_339]
MTRLLRFWPVAGLFGALLVVLGPAIAAGKLLAYGDALVQDFPLRQLAVQAWRQGVVPFWNPFSFGGMPLLATVHVGVFYPGNWSFLVLPPVAAMNVAVLLAYWVAGASTYLLAREQGLSRASGFGAGLVFMGSGFMVSHLENLQIIQAAGLMPLILWAIARHARAKDGRYVRLFALLLALQVLAGHPQMTIFTGLVAVAYALWLGLQVERRQPYLAGLALGCMLGLGLVALQLLPTLDFIPLTQRSVINYDQLSFRSLPWHQLITFWFPYAYGVPGGTPEYWGAPTFTDVTGYAGLASLVLGTLALLYAPTRRTAGFWAGVAIAAGLLALGSSTPLIDLVAVLPVLSSLPAPGRHMVEVDLALALLAGLGLEALAKVTSPARPLVAWALMGLPVLAVGTYVVLHGQRLAQRLQPFMPSDTVLAGAFSLDRPNFFVPIVGWLLIAIPLAFATLDLRARRGAQALVLGLLACDLAAFALAAPWGYRCVTVPEPLMPASAELTRGDGRICPVSSAFIYPYQDLDSIRALRYPDWGSLAGVRSITGYDAFVPARYGRVMGRMQSTGVIESPELWMPRHHGADLLGVRMVLLDPIMAKLPIWAQRAREYGLRPAGDEPEARWLANPRALPRAWRLERAESAVPAQVDLHVMRDAGFDPARVGYLDAPEQVGPLAPGTVWAQTPDFNHIDLETTGAGPGLVAVSEGYDPGWRAFQAEGGELRVHRLDAVILGVEVPAGTSRITLRYEPPRWRLGLLVSALALLALLAWELAERRRPKPVAVSGT